MSHAGSREKDESIAAPHRDVHHRWTPEAQDSRPFRHELGYRGRSDNFHLSKAEEMDAIVLTHDADFLMMASSAGVTHRGILFSHAKNVSIGDCIRGVELIANVLSDRDMRNHIEFL